MLTLETTGQRHNQDISLWSHGQNQCLQNNTADLLAHLAITKEQTHNLWAHNMSFRRFKTKTKRKSIEQLQHQLVKLSLEFNECCDIAASLPELISDEDQQYLDTLIRKLSYTAKILRCRSSS